MDLQTKLNQSRNTGTDNHLLGPPKSTYVNEQKRPDYTHPMNNSSKCATLSSFQ